MLKQVPEKVTYAQKRLLDLIENRELRKYCIANGLSHTAIYKIAIGDIAITYKTVASMSHLIPPIEWLFFTDEKLPYEARVIPQWDYNKIPKFIIEHRSDYEYICKRYGIDQTPAFNMFVRHISKPSLKLIRAACEIANPVDFFTENELPIQNKNYVCERGDIIIFENQLYFVISKKNNDEYITVCKILHKEDSFIGGTKVPGYIQTSALETLEIKRKKIGLIEKTSEPFITEIINKVMAEIFG